MADGTDIYNRKGSNFGGAMSADGASLLFSSAAASVAGAVGTGVGGVAGGAGGNGLPTAGVGLLTQQMSLSYAQQITRLFEVGTNNTYYVAGRTQGQLTLARVIGPRPIQTAFYTNYGDVCNAANNNIMLSMTAGCDQPLASTKLTFLLKNVVLTSIGISTAAENNIVNENLQAMIVALSLVA